jgi:hypothetical protein
VITAINYECKCFGQGAWLPLLVLALTAAASAQRIAVISPDSGKQSIVYAERLQNALDAKFQVLDSGMALSAYASLKIEDPYNLAIETAKNIGTLIGCDHFVMVKAQTDRRSSSARPSYFEASAFIYLVDSRTGRLEHWLLASAPDDSSPAAEKKLNDSSETAADAIYAKIKDAAGKHRDEPRFEMFDPDNKSMRPAMPYKRIKPEYTNTAFLFDVKAVIDAEVSIDETGNVRRIDIVRWAGFDLEESVIAAVRKMNWRPGERDGKPLAMRVLLRYNFTKIDKE